jgi:hypothetical protein
MICQCGTDISDPLRQFGPREEPLCWDCYSGETLPEDERRFPPEMSDWQYERFFTVGLIVPAQEAGR